MLGSETPEVGSVVPVASSEADVVGGVAIVFAVVAVVVVFDVF